MTKIQESRKTTKTMTKRGKYGEQGDVLLCVCIYRAVIVETECWFETVITKTRRTTFFCFLWDAAMTNTRRRLHNTATLKLTGDRWMVKLLILRKDQGKQVQTHTSKEALAGTHRRKMKVSKWASEKQKACLSFSPNLLTAAHALRITPFLRRTPELYSSSTSMTTFGMAEQGVGLFLGFGKCLESQQGTDGNPKHHPGWGRNRKTAEWRKVSPSEWKLVSLLHSRLHTHTRVCSCVYSLALSLASPPFMCFFGHFIWNTRDIGSSKTKIKLGNWSHRHIYYEWTLAASRNINMTLWWLWGVTWGM